jgi:hypothetical protein
LDGGPHVQTSTIIPIAVPGFFWLTAGHPFRSRRYSEYLRTSSEIGKPTRNMSMVTSLMSTATGESAIFT